MARFNSKHRMGWPSIVTADEACSWRQRSQRSRPSRLSKVMGRSHPSRKKNRGCEALHTISVSTPTNLGSTLPRCQCGTSHSCLQMELVNVAFYRGHRREKRMFGRCSLPAMSRSPLPLRAPSGDEIQYVLRGLLRVAGAALASLSASGRRGLPSCLPPALACTSTTFERPQ
jgi:hypothetical protein